MTLSENYQKIILSDLRDIILELDGYRIDVENAVDDLTGTALADEIYYLTQISFTLGNTVEILNEIRRGYYAASKACDKDLG